MLKILSFLENVIVYTYIVKMLSFYVYSLINYNKIKKTFILSKNLNNLTNI